MTDTQAVPDRQEESTLEVALTLAVCLLGFLFALIIAPFILPLSLIFRIYRHKLHKKILEETEGDAIIASGDDAVWFQDTPRNPAVINSVMFLKGKFELEKYEKLCQERIVEAKDDKGNLIAPKFSYYVTQMYHRYVWLKDKNFDIKNHVKVWDGPLPKSQEEMEELVGRLCSKELPKDISPWQMLVVPCYKGDTAVTSDEGDDDDVFPVIFRVHHGIGDGVSLMKLMMQQVMDVSLTVQDQMPKKFASKGIAMRIVKAVFTGPAMILGRIFWPADNHALHGPELTGEKLFTWSKNMDLNLIKRMKNATGTTVNDILMTCLAGAFHQYFKRYASEIPPDILTYVPVDIRSPSAKLVVDNQFALVFLKLPVNLPDRLQRLAEVKARMSRIKTSAEPLVNALAIRYLMARFPNWLTQLLFDNISSKCSLVLSNVPGPQAPCYMAGLGLQQMVFWPPQRCNVGMGISILSYNGTVKTGLMLDKRLCSTPHRLLGEFENEVKAMAEQLNVLEEPSKSE